MHKIKALLSWFNQPRQQDQVLLIKGTYYYDADLLDSTGQLSLNMALQLHPEPDNEYDANAIQIWSTFPTNHPHLLGYIPRSEAKRINQLLRHRCMTACRLETCYRQYQRLYLYARITSRLTFCQKLKMHWYS